MANQQAAPADRETRLCPLCGGQYAGDPVLWCLDRRTMLCPACAKKEADRLAGVNRTPRAVSLRGILRLDGRL